MSIIEAILLGILQGLTEFLPVSSSGHLVLGKTLLGIDPGENVVFEVVVHAATVLATITVLWKTIVQLCQQTFRLKWNLETQYVCKLLISMIPVLVIGLFFKDSVEQMFGFGAGFVGCMLLLTALLLLLSRVVRYQARRPVGYFSALIIGIAQAIAVLPGLSRSGSTIATGLMLGVRKEEVAQFSFLMVLVPILGEAFLSAIGGDFSAANSGISTPTLIAGFVSAYVSGVLACRWMIALVKKINLLWFSLYCFLAGSIAIIFTWVIK
ncbi:MAG: undecaprenyl-diphosphate phosphatase [Bacteroidales bacterium]|jgi:undecaprenyl-diphosphatase|nr:undecaprenyl-diphosphate phosphatase [Bacteroidales bacterium]